MHGPNLILLFDSDIGHVVSALVMESVGKVFQYSDVMERDCLWFPLRVEEFDPDNDDE